MIVAPTFAAPANLVTMTGALQSVQGDSITVNGVIVVIGPTARVTGDLQVGASVRIVASTQDDGTLQAQSVSVTDIAVEATLQPTAMSAPSSVPTQQVQASPTRGVTPESTEPPMPRVTVGLTAQPTEGPEVNPTNQPTEKPEVNPTESAPPQSTPAPEPRPTTAPPAPRPTESPEVRPVASPPVPQPTDRPETPEH